MPNMKKIVKLLGYGEDDLNTGNYDHVQVSSQFGEVYVDGYGRIVAGYNNLTSQEICDKYSRSQALHSGFTGKFKTWWGGLSMKAFTELQLAEQMPQSVFEAINAYLKEIGQPELNKLHNTVPTALMWLEISHVKRSKIAELFSA